MLSIESLMPPAMSSTRTVEALRTMCDESEE
jgi:hypothetical protein